MPLDTLTSKLADMTMDILGETINARYYWQRVGGEDFEKYLSMSEDMRQADASGSLKLLRHWCAFLARVLESWDFRVTEGGPFVPLTEDGLFALGPEIVGVIIRAFFENMRLGEPTGDDSPAPLPPTTTRRSRKS